MKKIIGIGNKARQGKDLTAEILNKKLPNSIILHFADALYKECRNEGNDNPIIYKVTDGYMILTDSKRYVYISTNTNSQLIKNVYNKLVEFNIVDDSGVYLRMEEKDSKLLQWWGTDFRRNLFRNDYWIKQLENEIKNSTSEIILIPDTRFKNEYEFIKDYNGMYLKVERYNEDGSRFIAKDRDPNHLSECDLDDVEADWVIINNHDKYYLTQEIETFILAINR